MVVSEKSRLPAMSGVELVTKRVLMVVLLE